MATQASCRRSARGRSPEARPSTRRRQRWRPKGAKVFPGIGIRVRPCVRNGLVCILGACFAESARNELVCKTNACFADSYFR